MSMLSANKHLAKKVFTTEGYIVVGASLSEPHTIVVKLGTFYIYMYIYVHRPVYSRFACSNLTICNISLPRVDLQQFIVYSCEKEYGFKLEKIFRICRDQGQ